MKRQYINAIYSNLILERDFDPVRNNGIGFAEPLVLQKYRKQVYFLVQFIDGDLLSVQGIEEKLRADSGLNIENSSDWIFHLIDVFVFDEPDPDKLAAVQRGSEPNRPYHPVKKYLSCFTVDLNKRTVTRYPKSVVDANGVDKLLQKYLHKPCDGYEVLPEIQNLLALRRKEYAIDFKAHKPIVTYTLIGINVAVFLLISFLSQWYGRDFNMYGAKVNQSIIEGQYWRLLTPVFLHANLLHLLVNCYSLYVLGQIMERIYGHHKFALIYFTAGLFGSVASFIFSINPSVGASGAIFGLFGALLYYGVEQPKVYKKYFGSDVMITFGINIAIFFMIPNIDSFAHLGGLVGGFLTAFAIKVKSEPEKWRVRLNTYLVVFFIAMVGLLYGLRR